MPWGKNGLAWLLWMTQVERERGSLCQGLLPCTPGPLPMTHPWLRDGLGVTGEADLH